MSRLPTVARDVTALIAGDRIELPDDDLTAVVVRTELTESHRLRIVVVLDLNGSRMVAELPVTSAIRVVVPPTVAVPR